MCPLCLSTIAWLGMGGGSAASLAALAAVIRRKGKDDGNDHDNASRREP